MSKKKGGFWSDFKAFITRGNVVDMAVGVVIGGAFGKIVTGLVNYVINPCVSLLTDGTDLDNIKTVLRKGVEATEGVEAVPEVAILWGTWIQTILDFILVAFCIFLVLRVMMHAKNRLDAKPPKPPRKRQLPGRLRSRTPSSGRSSCWQSWSKLSKASNP